MGYNSAELTSGFKAAGASFAATSGTMDLQDLKVTGYSDAFEGALNVQFLNANGRTTAQYFWADVPADPDDPDSEAFYGWYDGDDQFAENVTIAPGTGLWVQSDSASYGLQSAGQVITVDTPVTLRSGFIMAASTIPVSVDIQDIYIGGYSDAFEGAINLQFLTANGKTSSQYFWADVPADPDDPDSEAFYGWYDGDDQFAENVTIPAGGAVWVQSDSAAYSIVFPGVTL